MKKGTRIALTTLVLASLIAGLAVLVIRSPWAKQVVRTAFSGAVLVNDPDPSKQTPLANATVTVQIGSSTVSAHSEANGYFHLILPRRLPNQQASLSVTHAGYETFEDNALFTRQLYVARLTPTAVPNRQTGEVPKLSIRNVKIRYTVKAANAGNIGSIVRSFAVRNLANVPCKNDLPCSPDTKWKARLTKVSYDAGDNNEFVDIRASCVAGPCAFTRVQSSNIANPVRVIELSVLNWSDTATYLVEAEVRRTMISDMVRQAFPAILGSSMDFSLPAQAEGPSIEAELNGTDIVFPLGPNLLLSWATCTVETAREQTHLYRCDLKPSFQFQ